MRRPEARPDQVVTRLRPCWIVSRPRADQSHWDSALGRWCALDDRLEQAGGRASAHQLVDVAQMQAKLVVPDRGHAPVVLAAEPPEPIAALRDQDLSPR